MGLRFLWIMIGSVGREPLWMNGAGICVLLLGATLELRDIYLDSEALDTFDNLRIVGVPQERSGPLRFGLAISYDDMYGWRIWTSSLIGLLWTHLSAPEMRVVGWDVLAVDLPMIAHVVQAQKMPTALDLSAQIRAATARAYKLDTVARANLGRGKVMDTVTVIEWLRLGDSVSMSKATEYCRNKLQLVIDLYKLIKQGQPLVLPGRLRPAEALVRRDEETLRVWFSPQGEWARCEDTKGHVLSERQQPGVPADL